MRVAIVVVAVMLCAAVWYALKIQEPCTSKGGRVAAKDHKFVCIRDGQILP